VANDSEVNRSWSWGNESCAQRIYPFKYL